MFKHLNTFTCVHRSAYCGDVNSLEPLAGQGRVICNLIYTYMDYNTRIHTYVNTKVLPERGLLDKERREEMPKRKKMKNLSPI